MNAIFCELLNVTSLVEMPPGEHQTLFRKKLQACAITYDFTRNVDLKAKESKRQTLLELIECVMGYL